MPPMGPVQCDPRINQLVFLDKRMILSKDGVKFPCHNAAAAPSLAQEAEPRVASGLKVYVEQTHDGTGSIWGRDINVEHVPLAPARQIHAEDAVERDLTPSLTSLPPNPPSPLPLSAHQTAETLAGEQSHIRERRIRTRRVVLGVNRYEARPHSGVTEERFPHARGAPVTPCRKIMSRNLGLLKRWSRTNSERAAGLDQGAYMFQDVRDRLQCLLPDGATRLCWARRPLVDWLMRVAQRYSCPSMAGVVEGGNSTTDPFSVEEQH
ncbi:hypothetical protein EYR36_009142 [Pleurotus pulmonarius]|nr:hypothetical protein EYR36_009142 [Pleurotus pulmonarius]